MSNNSDLNSEMLRFFHNAKQQHVTIVAIFNSESLPPYCAHMPLSPEPEVNIELSSNFMELWRDAFKVNPGIHDGAILIQNSNGSYFIKSWANRLYPPQSDKKGQTNKGSGYHSSLNFSMLNEVECVYLIKPYSVYKFVKGEESVLFAEND